MPVTTLRDYLYWSKRSHNFYTIVASNYQVNMQGTSEVDDKLACVAVFIGLLLSVVAALITDIRLQHRYRGSSFRQLSDRERYLILSNTIAT